MSTEVIIRLAPEAEAIAAALIPEHHAHLLDARILYLFTSQERRRQGRLVLATTTKLGALPRFLSSMLADYDPEHEQPEPNVKNGFDFLMLIGAVSWAWLPSAGRVALVDHELSHCTGVEGAWAVVGHDVEEFAAIVERHGLWHAGLEDFGKAVQAGLPGLVEAR